MVSCQNPKLPGTKAALAHTKIVAILLYVNLLHKLLDSNLYQLPRIAHATLFGLFPPYDPHISSSNLSYDFLNHEHILSARACNTGPISQYRYFGIGKNQYRYNTGIQRLPTLAVLDATKCKQCVVK